MEEFLHFVGSLVQQEKARGHIRPDVDEKIVAYNFVALYFGALMVFFRDPTMAPQTAVDTLGKMVKQYMDGIMATRINNG